MSYSKSLAPRLLDLDGRERLRGFAVAMAAPIRRRMPWLWLVLSALAPLAPTDAAAGVVFSNFGPGLSYDTHSGNPVGNAFDSNLYAQASSFTSASSFNFDSLVIALSCSFSCPDPITVTLARDNTDQPGALIESFAVLGGSLGAFGSNNAPLVLSSMLHPLLSAGTRYWVAVNADAHDTVAWNLNSTGDLSDQAISTNGGATWFSPTGNAPGAFEVLSISTAPEPGSAGLVGASLLLMALRRRR